MESVRQGTGRVWPGGKHERLSAINNVHGGTTMTDVSEGASYRDRKVGLVLFGVVQLLIGITCALMVPLMILSMLVGATVDPSNQMSARMMVPGVLFYVAIAVWFTWLGIGSMLARRWARTIILVSSWIAFVCGIGGLAVWLFMAPDMFEAMGELGQMPPHMATVMQVVLTLFMAFIYIVGPGAHILFYRSRHVRATCEARDSRIRWTDKCPPHVLALSFMFWMWGGSLATMWGYNFALPFFGSIISGLPGALVTMIYTVLCCWLAWGVYRLKAPAWWGSLFLTLVFMGSAIATFSRVTLIQYYEAMDFPAEQLDLLRSIDLDSSSMMGISMLVYTLGFMGYIFFTRRFFPGGSTPFSPPVGDAGDRKPMG